MLSVHIDKLDQNTINKKNIKLEPIKKNILKYESTHHLIKDDIDLDTNKFKSNIKIENPLIMNIDKEYLEKVKGYPARSLRVIEKHKHVIFPKKYDEIKKDKVEIIPTLTEDIMSFKSKNLIHFDCWEDELTPEEWIERYKNNKNDHALTPVYEDFEYKWKPCRVRV